MYQLISEMICSKFEISYLRSQIKYCQIMSLKKLISWIGQGSTKVSNTGSNSGKLMKLKTVYERNTMFKSGRNALSPMMIHERNGSRGDGLGMGHNRQRRMK